MLKERLGTLRPGFVAARRYQRTSYLPGEISQLDWWHTGVGVPVGKGTEREAFGLVATLPHSAAHATVFTFSRTTADFCRAALGCYVRLGGLAEKAVLDNESAMASAPSRRRSWWRRWPRFGWAGERDPGGGEVAGDVAGTEPELQAATRDELERGGRLGSGDPDWSQFGDCVPGGGINGGE